MEVGARHAETKKSGKRSRREVTAERRQKESDAFQEIFKVLPISKAQLEKANQNSLLALTANYLRVRDLARRMGKSIVDMKNVSMEEQLMFRGFVLVVDTSRVILYASENITEQLGPYLADVIGQSFCEILHPEDRRDLMKGCQECCHGETKGMFVVRMRTSMAPALRSESRMEYKSVFVSSFTKHFDKEGDPDATVAVMLCRTSDLAGFPEIVMGAYLDFVVKFPQTTFTYVDPKTPWLLGYKVEDLMGQHPGILKHPSDFNSEDGRETEAKDKQLQAKLVQNGSLELPKTRALAAWGEWLWVSTAVTLRKDSRGQADPSSANVRMTILGPVTNSSVTHVDRGAITDGMMANGFVTDAMMSVGGGDPGVPKLLPQSQAMSGEGDAHLTSNGVDTLLDWDVMAGSKVMPFSDGLLEAEHSSTNGSSSGYISNPDSPWPLSAATTTSSSTSNLWSASSSASPHQWPLSPKEEGMYGEYGSPLSAQMDPSEALYTHSMNVLDIQDPFPQADPSIDDILFSVLNTPS